MYMYIHHIYICIIDMYRYVWADGAARADAARRYDRNGAQLEGLICYIYIYIYIYVYVIYIYTCIYRYIYMDDTIETEHSWEG